MSNKEADNYNPTVLITGANRGIGLEFARQYAELGWKVIAASRHPDGSDALQSLAGQYPDVAIEALDVTKEAQITALASKYSDQPIDLLINNAGISGRLAFLSEDFKVEDFRETLEINTFAPLRVSQAFLGSVLQSRHKKIAVMASRLGSIEYAPLTSVDGPFEGELYYAISKAGINIGMRRLATKLKSEGVDVALLFPGPVATDMLKTSGFDPTQIQTPEQAVSGMVGFLDAFESERSGRFFGHDGVEAPW